MFTNKNKKACCCTRSKGCCDHILKKPNETFKTFFIQFVLNIERGMMLKLCKRVET